jgi:hypothetical protein
MPKKRSERKTSPKKSPRTKRVSCSKHPVKTCKTTNECAWVPHRKPGCVRRWGGAKTAEEAARWANLTRREILEYAKNIELRGRSKMNKDELIRAIYNEGTDVSEVEDFLATQYGI